ncbi:MAG: MBL fold metallo-hydrolase [Promethearchaeota archaeon]
MKRRDSSAGFSVTYYGYAALLVHLEKLVLIDPGILHEKPLVETTAVCASYILVSHAHPENIGNTANHAIDNGTMVISNNQVIEELQRQNTPGYYLEPLANGEVFDTKTGTTFTSYELRHSGFLAPRNTAFLVTGPQGSVLHLGHAKAYDVLRNSCPDLLCISIAGKKKGTMDPSEAADATVAIRARYVLPICGDATQDNDFMNIIKKRNTSATLLRPKIGETYKIR